MDFSPALTDLVAKLISNDIFRTTARKTTCAQDRTTHREQLEHGFDNDSLTVNIKLVETKLPSYLGIQLVRWSQSEAIHLRVSQVSLCTSKHGMQLYLAVHESLQLQPAS